MKCPHCNYTYDFDHDSLEPVDNSYGEFFQLSEVHVARDRGRDYRNVFGCPKCSKLFMDYID